jgi:hypothetical protein
MEKRIFTAVLISIGFLMLWAWVAPKVLPQYFRQPARTSSAPSPRERGEGVDSEAVPGVLSPRDIERGTG